MNKKYFIAIVLKDELLEKAESIKRELFEKYDLKGALRSPAHITLHRPFQWKEEKETQLVQTLEQFKDGHAFELGLNNFNCFEPRVIYIDVKHNGMLFELQRKLAKHVSSNLGLLNEVEDLRGFHPHITIAFRDLKKPVFYALWEDFKNRTFSGAMHVNSFELLRLEDKWQVIKSVHI